MLLDELKIEQDDLKVGDVVYTSHHPNIGVWVSFRYSKMRKEVIQRITPKRTKIVTDYGEYTNRDHFYKMTDELKKQSEIAEAAETFSFPPPLIHPSSPLTQTISYNHTPVA